jgi:hypothetical protein
MTLYKSTEFYTEWFSVYPNITSKFRTIVLFKNCVNQIINQIKLVGMSMISYKTKVYLSKCNVSWVVSTKQTMIFNIQLAAMFVFFVFDKNGLIKSCSSFEDLSENKILWSHVDWCKFCIHLRSFTVRHFGIVKGTRLKSTASRSPSMAWPPYWIYKNLPIGSKVIRGDTQTDRQTDWWSHKPHFPFEGSRLKIVLVNLEPRLYMYF